MCSIPTQQGYLRISNENDRATVATILYKNGYTCSPARKKKDGKTNVYYVRYEIRPVDIPDEEDAE